VIIVTMVRIEPLTIKQTWKVQKNEILNYFELITMKEPTV
jgi:hypothetical protein